MLTRTAGPPDMMMGLRTQAERLPLQVREQERCIAVQIRKEVQRRRRRELQRLAEELRGQWDRQQEEKLQALHRLLQEKLGAVGEGYRSAKENEPDWAAVVQKAGEDEDRAVERHRAALKELRWQREKREEEQSQHTKARRKAMLTEKARAAKVTSRPPRPPDPIENIQMKWPPVLRASAVDRFSSTRYHLPDVTVDREVGTDQPDARLAAEEEGRRLEQLGQEGEREKQERLEKASLRGKRALRKEHLAQDHERLLQQLDRMQQADQLCRSQRVAHMPPQIFQPSYRRQEMAEERQRELEAAFEDLYVGERRVGGPVLRLVPDPLPAAFPGSQDEELDVTLEPSAAETAEVVDESRPADWPAEQQAQPATGAPRDVLRKLLDRIRAQRTRQGETTPVDSATIESGSLSSGEMEKLPSAGPSQSMEPESSSPAQQVSACEVTEDSVGTESLPHLTGGAVQPDPFEAERRKWAELEKQKQELLKELAEIEEQRRSLEAASEKRGVAESRASTPEARAQNASSTPAPVPRDTAGQEVPSLTAEDEHSRRIKQHQQCLLERNRLHQQSVQQARRHLEEYKGLLKMKYPSMVPLPPRGTPPPVTVPSLTPLLPPPIPTEPHLPRPLLQSDSSAVPQDIAAMSSQEHSVATVPPSLAEPPRLTRLMAERDGGEPVSMDTSLIMAGLRNGPKVVSERLGPPLVPDWTAGGDEEQLVQSRAIQEPGRQMALEEKEAVPQPETSLDPQVVLAGMLFQQRSRRRVGDRGEEDDEARLSGAQLSSAAVQRETAEHLCLPSSSSSVTHLRTTPRLSVPKPPLARPRMGILEMIEQHELSAIQEVETPDDTSLSAAGKETPETSCALTEEPAESEGSSYVEMGRSAAPHDSEGSPLSLNGRLSWREWLQMETGSQPGVPPDPAQGFPHKYRASVKFGGEPTVHTCSPRPVCHRADDLEFSTTISTGSFTTTEPDLSSVSAGGTPSSFPTLEVRRGGEAAVSPTPCESEACGSSVQRIIDKYTKELNESLRAGSADFDLGVPPSFIPLPVPGSQDNTARLSGERTLWRRDSVQDLSIPTSGQMLPAGSSPYSPEAHSLSLGRLSHGSSNRFLPLEPAADSDSSPSFSSCHLGGHEQTRRAEEWDSAMRRIIERLSSESPSQCQGEGQDSRLSLLIGQLLSHSCSWLDGENDIIGGYSVTSPLSVDADSHTRSDRYPRLQEISSDVLHPEQYGSSETSRPEHFALTKEPPPEQQYGERLQDGILVGALSDSFHPLLAETTAHETAECSLTFHPPVESPLLPRSPDPHWDLEQSLEHLRNESLDALRCPSPTPLCGSLLEMSSARDTVLPVAGSSPPSPDSGHLANCNSHGTAAGEPQANPKSTSPVWERVMETDPGRGILEEPELTLVSLAETTLQEEDKRSGTVEQGCDGQPGETCGLAGDDRGPIVESKMSHTVMLLEFDASAGSLQQLFLQKRQDFIRKSAQRQEELKARNSRESVPAGRSKVKPQQEVPGNAAPQAAALELQRVGEVTIRTAEQRKVEDAEMYRRTQRLYNQLEEVRQCRQLRTRQQAYARNRARARDFHKKTLLKLRAQRTPR